MGKAPSWEKPGADNWVEARKALFVIESRLKGGMGGDEVIPFSDQSAAEKFVGKNGGHIVTFDQMPRDYVLASDGAREGVPADDDGDPRHRPSD